MEVGVQMILRTMLQRKHQAKSKSKKGSHLRQSIVCRLLLCSDKSIHKPPFPAVSLQVWMETDILVARSSRGRCHQRTVVITRSPKLSVIYPVDPNRHRSKAENRRANKCTDAKLQSPDLTFFQDRLFLKNLHIACVPLSTSLRLA